MTSKKPVPTPLSNPGQKKPKPSDAKAPKKWAFSFRFFKQIENFGLDKCDVDWCSALLERLSDLGAQNVGEFLADHTRRGAYRYHEIDWGAKNIPIQRKDLTWLSAEYRDNPDEYPIVQFQLTKSHGRVVGFFDEHYVFNILLLDPLHNMQPAGDHNYRVDVCSPQPTPYMHLVNEIERVRKKECLFVDDCELAAAVRAVPSTNYSGGLLTIQVDGETHQSASGLINAGLASSYSEIIGLGLAAYENTENTGVQELPPENARFKDAPPGIA